MNDATIRGSGKRVRQKRWMQVWLSVVLVLSLLPTAVLAESGMEEGDIKEHDLFDFEAFITHDGITDGTADFDDDDEPGNDSGPNNGIVRTFDTVTYPVKMTVNPKQADSLHNILIRLTGTLENGITEDRVNANFAIGGTEDLATEEVSFVQEYTIEQTGNSVMLPVTVEVQGAPHGLALTPTIQVEVVSIDGEVLETPVATVFDELPAVTTSGKVSLKGLLNKGLGGTGYPYYPYANMYPGGAEENGMNAFSVSWSAEKLPNKTDMRGSTFPDKDGTINYTVELYGQVYWDNGTTSKTEVFDFEGRDTPFLLFDHQPIEDVRVKIGQPHMLWDGKSYTNRYAGQYVAANSKMKDFKDATIKKNAYNTVWDSGDWTMGAPEQSKDKVVYKGTNTGFTIGSTFPIAHSYVADNGLDKVYGVNDKVFSTHAFVIDMQNEYRIGGVNNPENKSNNVYYQVRLILDNYTAADGTVTEYNKTAATSFVLRNGTGGMGVYGTFQAYPSGYTSPANPRNYNTSVGDASILVGQDVNFTPRLNPSDTLYGGYTAAYRWNTDAFELTKNYADKAEANIYARGYRNLSFDWVVNDRQKQIVKYGVAKFTDNSFENFTSKGIDDYTWYATFDQAVAKGRVGAILSDVQASLGGMKGAAINIPLKVRHDNIGFGSVTKQGTPVIALTNADIHYDEARTVTRDITANNSYANPSLWDDEGTLLEMQKPVGGGSVNFESLGIVPGKTSSVITANKDTYYNSETIKWDVESGIVLPPYGVPTGVDTGVTLTQTLPKGLDYKTGSGRVGGEAVEPEMVRNADGETELSWRVLIDVLHSKIPDVSFDTTINPFALTTSVQSGVTVSNVIESALDGRPIKARTDSETVTVLKVGMVGIHERIDKTYGKKDSAYTVTLSPYTTIEDERDVTGLTHLPLSGDALGSDYEGDAAVTEIQVNVDRKHEEHVSVYLNRRAVYDNQPQTVDVTTDGWYEYTGDPAELVGAVSLWFRVEGLMTNTDDITLDVTVQTNDNAFGDEYLNETVVNSATGYRLSPVSNRVRYQIRADLELGLERVRIYTNVAEQGLPVNVRVAQRVLDAEAVKALPVTLAVYDRTSGDKVTEKTVAQQELQTETELLIPGDALTSADVNTYEVRLEGVDESTVWIKDAERQLDADGHTAAEKTLTNADKRSDGSVRFTGVIMTERALRGSLVTYNETLTIPAITQPRVKSGYGFEFESTLTYASDLMADVENRLGVTYTPDADLLTDNLLMDDSLSYRNADLDVSPVPMLRSDEPGTGASLVTRYQLPKLYLEQGTGHTYSALQKEAGDMMGLGVDAGHKLYVPLWTTPIGTYDAALVSAEPLGAHRVSFSLMNTVDVYGSMFSYIGSDTQDSDELLIRPMNPKEDEVD